MPFFSQFSKQVITARGSGVPIHCYANVEKTKIYIVKRQVRQLPKKYTIPKHWLWS